VAACPKDAPRAGVGVRSQSHPEPPILELFETKISALAPWRLGGLLTPELHPVASEPSTAKAPQTPEDPFGFAFVAGSIFVAIRVCPDCAVDSQSHRTAASAFVCPRGAGQMRTRGGGCRQLPDFAIGVTAKARPAIAARRDLGYGPAMFRL